MLTPASSAPSAQIPELTLSERVRLMQGNGGYFWKTDDKCNKFARAYHKVATVYENVGFGLAEYVLPKFLGKPLMSYVRNDPQRYIGVIPAVRAEDAPSKRRFKLPPLLMNDGPQGFRAPQDGQHDGSSTQFPSNLSLAATWDDDVAYAYGEALGVEFRTKGSNVVLGPAVNVHRVPWNGRNFEYMTGEDATLGSMLLVPYVKGIQGAGVMACAKHLGFNEQETDRVRYASRVPEEAQQEIYLKPFRAALFAGAGAAMTAYNRVAEDEDRSEREQGDDAMYAWESAALLAKVGLGRGDDDRRIPFGKEAENGSYPHLDAAGPQSLSFSFPWNHFEKAFGAEIAEGKGRAMVMSDWWATTQIPMSMTSSLPKEETAKARARRMLAAGLDMEMPGTIGPTNANPAYYSAMRLEALAGDVTVASGEITPKAHVEAAATRIATAMADRRWLSSEPSEDGAAAATKTATAYETGHIGAEATSDEHRKLARRIAEESLVLLKNVGGAEVGNSSETPTSPALPSWFSQNGRDGEPKGTTGEAALPLSEREEYRIWFESCDSAPRIPFFVGDWKGRGMLHGGGGSGVVIAKEEVSVKAGLLLARKKNVRGGSTAKDKTSSDEKAKKVVVVCLSAWAREDMDRPRDLNDLNPTEFAQKSSHGRSKKVGWEKYPAEEYMRIAIVSAPGAVDLNHVAAEAHAVLLNFYGGEQIGHAVANVLFGQVNPAGKLPVTLPAATGSAPSEQSQKRILPSQRQYPGEKLRKTDTYLTVHYDEGLAIGYRWYEQESVTPLYSFGFGLSYRASGVKITSASFTAGVTPESRKISLGLAVPKSSLATGLRLVPQFYVQHQDRKFKELLTFAKTPVVESADAAPSVASATWHGDASSPERVGSPSSGRGRQTVWKMQEQRKDTLILSTDIYFPEVVRWDIEAKRFQRLEPGMGYTMYVGFAEILADPYHKKVPLPRIPNYRAQQSPAGDRSHDQHGRSQISVVGRPRLNRDQQVLTNRTRTQ